MRTSEKTYSRTLVNKGKAKGRGCYAPARGRGRSLATGGGGQGGVKVGSPLCSVNNAGLVGPRRASLRGPIAGVGPGMPVAGGPGGAIWRALEGALESHRRPTVLHPEANLAVALIVVGSLLGGRTGTVTQSLFLGPIRGVRIPRGGERHRGAQGYRHVVALREVVCFELRPDAFLL